jgi:hypothetical protein
MALEFVSARTGAASPKMVAPTYPAGAARAGQQATVVAIVDFDERGKPSLRSFDFMGDRRYQDDFVESMQEAIARWKIDLERVGGHPVATSLRIPFVFCFAHCEPVPRDQRGQPIDTSRAVALDSAVKLLDARDPLGGG